MAIQVSGTSVISDGRLIQNLNGLVIPSGDTASRPGSPAQGQIYHNTQTDEFEIYATITTSAGYTTQYQGVVNGNNSIWSNYRINTENIPVPGGTPTPLALDTTYGIQFKTNETIISTDGFQHRLRFRYNIGYNAPSGDPYFYGDKTDLTITIPANGSEVSAGGGISYTWIGFSGGTLSGGLAIKLEKYSSGGTTSSWRKIGAY